MAYTNRPEADFMFPPRPVISHSDDSADDDEFDILYPLLTSHTPPRHERHQRRPSNTSDDTLNNSRYSSFRQKTRELLSSKYKHYFVVTLVSLDVTAILAEIFVTLVACDLHLPADRGWVHVTKEILHPFALVLTYLFMAELGTSIWAFGLQFFKEWFHCLDAAVIVISFVVDVFVRGVVEEIVSIVIVLRLWRLVKIVQEVSVGAAERMEELEGRVEELERECEELRSSRGRRSAREW
ncbi:hypothetical protein QBC43DRAFT_317534 [Cladorrhinum sp. PSN259]|nr:hypothetical protein QBC43DRAFT_317534 [Cladorrhinum sp. PSN259]